MATSLEDALEELALRRIKTSDRRVRVKRKLVRRVGGTYKLTPEVRSWMTERQMRPRLNYYISTDLDEDGEPIEAYEVQFATMAQAFEFKLRWK